MQKMELRYWREYGDIKTRISRLNEKRSLIQWVSRVPIWKISFCSRVLWLSEMLRCRERPQTTISCLEWLVSLKCLATGSDASLYFLFTSRKCSRSWSQSRLPISPTYDFLQKVQVMQSKKFKKENTWNGEKNKAESEMLNATQSDGFPSSSFHKYMLIPKWFRSIFNHYLQILPNVFLKVKIVSVPDSLIACSLTSSHNSGFFPYSSLDKCFVFHELKNSLSLD